MPKNKISKKVIFIGGSSYSGSTMLDMMLANDEEGFSVGEICALFHPYRPHHFNPQCGCGDPNCKLWLKVKKAGEKNLYETLFEIFPKISFIVDSSKDPWWINKQIKNLENKGINYYKLLIWKDPVAFAYSMIKRKRKGWIKAWINYHRLYLTLFSDFISVSYTSLVQNPQRELKQICNQIGISYFKGKEYFWNKKHHTLFGNTSAKIHLFPREKSKYVDLLRYRSIYYDSDYKEKIPKKIVEEIEHNDLIKKIKNLLVNNELNNAYKKEKLLTPYQLNFFKFKYLFLKRIAGRAIGRYIKLF